MTRPDRGTTRRTFLGGALAAGALTACGRASSNEAATSTSSSQVTALAIGGAGPTAASSATSTSTAGPAPPPASQAPTNCADGKADQLPLRARLGQLLLVSVGTTDIRKVADLVARTGLGGVYVDTPSVSILRTGKLSDLVTADGIPILVAIDDEGGRVQRTKAIGLPALPAARQLATSTPDEVYNLALAHGQRLRELGVTVDFAPVVDVGGRSAAIGDRSFSDDPSVVTKLGGAFALGLIRAGVLPTYKHFPGHGRAIGDSHVQSVTSPPIEEIRAKDLAPYRELLGPDKPVAVMVGHLDVPGLTKPGVPTSISPETINGLLRTELGFKGLVFTDELGGMKAISGRVGLPEAARQSIAAGADVPIWTGPERVVEVLDYLEGAVRRNELAEADVNRAVRNVLRAKQVVGTPARC